MTVREDDIRRADGSAGIYGVIDKPTYALIIPMDGDRFLLVDQFRYPVGKRCWEFPQGTAPDLAEVEPAELAARELREETGLRAGRMIELAIVHCAPGMVNQFGRIFLALDLVEGEPEREHEEQDMETAWFHREELEKMILAGEFSDAQSLAAYTHLMLSGRLRP